LAGRVSAWAVLLPKRVEQEASLLPESPVPLLLLVEERELSGA
jgi:hypothetical protein